jgi:hypothetical protein
MAGLVRAIHVVRLYASPSENATGRLNEVWTADAGAGSTTWMARTSPAMTEIG